MFGSTQLDARDPARLDGCGDSYQALGLAWRGGFGWPRATAAGDAEVFAPCAAAALYDLAAFRAAGGMDERFFCYMEDVDLGFRLRLGGGRAVQVSDAVVHHAGGAAGGRPHGFEAYHAMRNGQWCCVKNMPGPLFWPLLPGSMLAHALLSLRGGRAARRGWRDAMAGLGAAFAARGAVQARRVVGTGAIGRWLVWSPRAVRRRAPKRRSVEMS
jgi:GT2 family glycosyltransferase